MAQIEWLRCILHDRKVQSLESQSRRIGTIVGCGLKFRSAKTGLDIRSGGSEDGLVGEGDLDREGAISVEQRAGDGRELDDLAHCEV